jgi:hypothetical protein
MNFGRLRAEGFLAQDREIERAALERNGADGRNDGIDTSDALPVNQRESVVAQAVREGEQRFRDMLKRLGDDRFSD